MAILSVEQLQFGYKKNEPILKNLNLEVLPGSIYGFLGSNGAGKSTTIRNILGLLQPQSGEITIFGQKLNRAKRTVFQEIGALIESPSLYPHLHAIDNLKITCQYQNISTRKIDEVLDKVGLLSHRKKAVRKYSTGMKQRLGLALALIHNPQLLLLDEPTNGLDPSGITEIRKIILQLREEGKTILLSSHLLAEIEKIATHIGILKNGHLVFEGTLRELEALKSAQQQLEIKTNDPEKTKTLLSKYAQLSEEEAMIRIKIKQEKDIPELIRQLVNAGIDLYEVRLIKSDLEKMFINLTDDGKSYEK